jgi:hypothetical protein
MFNIISDIEDNTVVIYLFIITISGWWFNRMRPPYYTLIGIIVGIIIVYILYQRSEKRDNIFTKRIYKILKSDLFNNYKYLYLNSELVIFLDTHREYFQYNPSLYKSLLKNIDNFLKLGSDIENNTRHHNLDYSVMRELKNKILNNYHSIIHKLPHSENSLNKFHQGMDNLKDLLNDYLDNIHFIVNNKNRNKGVDVNTQFVYRNHPKPQNPFNDARWHFFSDSA